MVYQTNSREDTLIKRKGEFIDESEQSVIASIKMLGANIEHSARNNYRPYLMMYGEVSAVAFPNGRYQSFNPPTQVHVRYEFSDEEIGQLATKGLFYDGFKVPEIIADNPNIEIPMTATARRYVLMDNLYVTLDLASADIYTTNTQECGYIFADYFEEQIPHKLETAPIEQEEDVIPATSFDDDFAAQFSAEFEKAKEDASPEVNHEEFAKEIAQAQHQQSLITAEAQKLLEKSPTAQRERDKAKAIGIDIASGKSFKQVNKEKEDEDLAKLFESEDDEFATFRKAQEQFSRPKPVLTPSDGFPSFESDFKPDFESGFDESLKEKEAETDEVIDRASASDTSVNISVADNDGETAEDDKAPAPDFGNAFGDEFDELFDVDDNSDDNSEISAKDAVEDAVKNATSTKHNHNPQKLTAPNDSDDIGFSDGFDMNI